MKRKQLSLLLGLGFLIGGLGWYMASRNRATYGESGQALGGKLLPEFPMNDIARITIQEETNTVQLVKDEGVWRVQERHGYPADYSDVSALLRKIWELKIVQSEEIGPSQWPRLQMADPGQGTNSGTRLEFKDGSGKAVGTIVLGKKHMRQSPGPSQFGNEGWPDGRYLRVDGVPRVALVSDAFSEVEAKADRFLDKDFIKVEKLRSISVTHTNLTNSWALTRETETGPWTLVAAAEGEKLDNSKTSSLNYALSNPLFDDVASPDASTETTGLDQPVVARLETFEGFNYDVKIGRQTADEKYHVSVQVEGAYARERTAPADETAEDKERLDREFKETLAKLDEKLTREQSKGRWIYLVSKWTVDSLLKTRADFLDTKSETETSAPDDSDPSEVEDSNGDSLVPTLFE
ncbi:MAG: DUF4340 domain-containing protein [Verrucomicrobia bacterium]|nr:DUF4340 domain-containing protein [Verrucomicrobiota bacterium]